MTHTPKYRGEPKLAAAHDAMPEPGTPEWENWVDNLLHRMMRELERQLRDLENSHREPHPRHAGAKRKHRRFRWQEDKR